MIPNHQEDVKRSRACDLCLNKNAVWYCASDDAFLCSVCDESVHSANQVATKHERVCLRTNEIYKDVLRGTTSLPVWHSGFRRKARSPRVRKTQQKMDEDDDERRRRREDPRVPEIESQEIFFIPETDENDDDLISCVPEFQGFTEIEFFLNNHNCPQFDEMENLYCNEDGQAKNDGDDVCLEQSLIRVEEHEDDESSNAKQRGKMLLRLNYENVIAAWDKQEFSINNTTGNFQLVPLGTEEKKISSRSEREARVWRYRDKRKNRLFEKKIRYEVRKVNADKRPRMKGRFVRRSLATES